MVDDIAAVANDAIQELPVAVVHKSYVFPLEVIDNAGRIKEKRVRLAVVPRLT
jgi:hypothetical protein